MRLILILTALLAFQGAAASKFDETKALAELGMAAAQYDLALMYGNGEGVPENDAEAVKWYRKAADQGNADAQYNLGLMYVTGKGVPENNIRAYVWWSMAKTQGNTTRKRGYRSLEHLRLWHTYYLDSTEHLHNLDQQPSCTT